MMNQTTFQFTLNDSAHATDQDRDQVFTANYENGIYSVSFEGETVDYTEEDADRWIQEGFWVLL